MSDQDDDKRPGSLVTVDSPYHGNSFGCLDFRHLSGDVDATMPMGLIRRCSGLGIVIAVRDVGRLKRDYRVYVLDRSGVGWTFDDDLVTLHATMR